MKNSLLQKKKTSQQPKTVVFEQLVTTVQPTGFPEDREMYKKADWKANHYITCGLL